MSYFRNALNASVAVAVMFGCLVAKSAQAEPQASVGKLGVSTLPEGCGNPFADSAEFFAFYDQAIQFMAAKRGPKSKGLAELFAVAEIKRETDLMMINPQEESAVDRLISSQLCFFQKLQTRAKMTGTSNKNPLVIVSSDETLHDHLATLAPKLYRDARKLAVEILARSAKEKQKDNILQQKWADVRRAREEGRAKVRDLFE